MITIITIIFYGYLSDGPRRVFGCASSRDDTHSLMRRSMDLSGFIFSSAPSVARANRSTRSLVQLRRGLVYWTRRVNHYCVEFIMLFLFLFFITDSIQSLGLGDGNDDAFTELLRMYNY